MGVCQRHGIQRTGSGDLRCRRRKDDADATCLEFAKVVLVFPALLIIVTRSDAGSRLHGGSAGVGRWWVCLFISSTWFLCGYLLHISRMVTWAYPQHNRCLLLMESVALSAHLTLRESLLELGMGEASTRMQQHLNHGMQPPPVTMLRACCRHLHRRKALQMVNGIWIEN